METVVQGTFVGVVATIAMDIWALVAKHVFKLPTANWALVGRWFGHMSRGVFVHRPIADAPAIRHELAVGWLAHYITGIVYGVAYLGIVRVLLSATPSLISALVFGLATLVAPWLIMQPCMGAGIFASRTPHPNVLRLVNLSMHLIFAVFLYVSWLLL